jgi:hypothetical protein
VLCDIYSKETGIGNWELINLQESAFRVPGRQAAYTALHPEVKNWARLDLVDPKVLGKELSFHNDVEKLSFNQIADLIEENL